MPIKIKFLPKTVTKPIKLAVQVRTCYIHR